MNLREYYIEIAITFVSSSAFIVIVADLSSYVSLGITLTKIDLIVELPLAGVIVHHPVPPDTEVVQSLFVENDIVCAPPWSVNVRDDCDTSNMGSFSQPTNSNAEKDNANKKLNALFIAIKFNDMSKS